MAEHMPTPAPPWRIGATFDHHLNGYGIYASGCRVAIAGYLGGTETAKANAAFIVKAVNNHEALVKALDWAMARIIKKAPHHAHEGDGELYAFAEAHSLLAKLRPDDVGGARE